MKVLLHNGAYGLGNMGDDAILDGILATLPPGIDPTVVAWDAAEVQSWFPGVKVVGWRDQPDDYDVWAMWGGGILNPPHLQSMMPQLRDAMSQGKRVWFRAVGQSGRNDEDYNFSVFTDIFRRCEMVTVRSPAGQRWFKNWCGMDVPLERDPAWDCREEEDHPAIPEGTTLFNARRATQPVVKLATRLKGKVLPLVVEEHKTCVAEQEKRIMDALGFPECVFEPNPRRFKAMLRHCGLLITGHKHAGLLANAVGTPVRFVNSGGWRDMLKDDWKLTAVAWQ